MSVGDDVDPVPEADRRLRAERRPGSAGPPARQRLVLPVVTAIIAFFMGGLVVLATGHNPLRTYKAIFDGSGLSWFFQFGHYHIDLPFTSHRVFFWWNTDTNALAPFNLTQTLILTTSLDLHGACGRVRLPLRPLQHRRAGAVHHRRGRRRLGRLVVGGHWRVGRT